MNDWTVLDSTSFLLLSVGTYRSRDGVVHTDFVTPDEEIQFVPDDGREDDEALQAALAWLRD